MLPLTTLFIDAATDMLPRAGAYDDGCFESAAARRLAYARSGVICWRYSASRRCCRSVMMRVIRSEQCCYGRIRYRPPCRVA